MNNSLNIQEGYRSYSISLIRLMSMLFIITCHIMQWLNWELAWWFNVGVQIFLCISGYLYGQSPKREVTEYFKSRFVKILVPYYVVFVVAAIFEILFARSYINVVNVIGGLICFKTIPGGEHLWFVKYILLCYIFTPFLWTYRDRYVQDSRSWWLFSILSTFLTSVLFGTHIRSFNPAWMTCYVIGFALGANNGYCKLSVMMKLFGTAAVVCNGIQIFIDYIAELSFSGIVGTLFSYFQNYSRVVLGVFIFLAVKAYFDQINFPEQAVKLLDVADRYSYETYLVHQFLILGPFSLMTLTSSIMVNIILVFCSIAIMALALKKIITPIVRKMTSRYGDIVTNYSK